METKNSIINEKITARRKLIKSLWKNAYDVLTFIYGDMPEVRISKQAVRTSRLKQPKIF